MGSNDLMSTTNVKKEFRTSSLFSLYIGNNNILVNTFDYYDGQLCLILIFISSFSDSMPSLNPINICNPETNGL